MTPFTRYPGASRPGPTRRCSWSATPRRTWTTRTTSNTRTRSGRRTAQGIVVNAIQSGQTDSTTPAWQQIARLGAGQYFQVEQAGDAVAIATPLTRSSRSCLPNWMTRACTTAPGREGNTTAQDRSGRQAACGRIGRSPCPSGHVQCLEERRRQLPRRGRTGGRSDQRPRRPLQHRQGQAARTHAGHGPGRAGRRHQRDGRSAATSSSARSVN